MNIKTILAASAVALFGATGMASAAVVGSISTADDNDGVVPIYGVNSQMGLYGADWFLVGGPADISVTFLGREAGFLNEFDFGNDGVDFSNSQAAQPEFNPAGIVPSILYANVASGQLSFSFLTPNGPVMNGSNPDNSLPDSVNFFSYLHAGAQVLDLWLDDANGVDDNHDDMVIRLAIENGRFETTPVPVPAALPLLVGALGGLGLMARRRKS